MMVHAQHTFPANPATPCGRNASFAKTSALLLACWLAFARLDPADAATDAQIPPGERMETSTDGFALARPLGDFYDSVFVLTGPSGTSPRVLDVEALAKALGSYDVVFFGEIHGHSAIHLQQVKLLRALYARDPGWVLSLEQFERDVQDVLDDYLAGRIGERALTERGRAWDNYGPSYRPLLLFARDHALPVIAAEAPTWAISCIGQQGVDVLAQFTPAERSWLAQDLHLGPGPYRDRFMRFAAESASHGGGAAGSPEARRRAEQSFAAQAARDDTMAESIALARRKYPGRRVFHLNGHFHSESFFGTVERLRLRDPELRIAVIQPVEVDDPHVPGFTRAQQAEGTALLLVQGMPAPFAEGEDQSAWIRSIMSKRKASQCKYAPATPDQPASPEGSVSPER